MINKPKNKRNLGNIQPELRYGKMKTLIKYGSCASLLTMFMLPVTSTQAAVLVQCPGDSDGDAIVDEASTPDNVKCIHLSSSDGYANMGDGYLQYIFGYADLTGTPPEEALDKGLFYANYASPTIKLDEGDEFYLTLTNTGMMNRPDLFDTHTVHFHGFPEASSVFDGVPDASISINMGASLTYYYNIQEPGTYLYHCHVEAAEHMQMGMQGNLWVYPAQNKTWLTSVPSIYPGHVTADGVQFPPDPTGALGSRRYTQFAYNDGDGSTGFDVEMPLQLTGFDPVFHDASLTTQPLPFADMRDTYHQFNGRGYPHTVLNEYYGNDGLIPIPVDLAGKRIGQDENEDLIMKAIDFDAAGNNLNGNAESNDADKNNGDINSQPIASKIKVTVGEKLLLRIQNVSIVKYHTVTVLGLPMKVIARGARELIDKYDTASVNVGGGEAYDVVVDTLGVDPGTYFVYITELNELSNNQQSFGGPMTEIEVVPPVI